MMRYNIITEQFEKSLTDAIIKKYGDKYDIKNLKPDQSILYKGKKYWVVKVDNGIIKVSDIDPKQNWNASIKTINQNQFNNDVQVDERIFNMKLQELDKLIKTIIRKQLNEQDPKVFSKDDLRKLLLSFYLQVLGGFVSPTQYPPTIELKKNIEKFINTGKLK